ncbi:uncharacterized protein N7525_007313 [Penicillium rubens]|uniref:uncharacterized protein n=1 Tax=Penicillium rubens TaxID=1108849 RepID=UPI002A59CF94|nr:uncharacterized protein N7525_007313 [Penicillium rubens]KAJ5829060.1 hypothetical protein N7525_007313 [Penicillium rubens]
MATGFPAWIHNLPTPLPLDQVPRHIRLVGVSLNIHSGQANCFEPQPASPQAEAHVGFHSHGKAIISQNIDEYALINHTIGFHGQEAFSNMQKSYKRVAMPSQAVHQSLK